MHAEKACFGSFGERYDTRRGTISRPSGKWSNDYRYSCTLRTWRGFKNSQEKTSQACIGAEEASPRGISLRFGNQTNHSKSKLNPQDGRHAQRGQDAEPTRKLGPGSREDREVRAQARSHHQTNRSNATKHEQVRCELVIDRVRPQKPAGCSRWLRSGQPPPVFYILSGAITPRRPSPAWSTFLVAAHKASLRRLKSSSSTST